MKEYLELSIAKEVHNRDYCERFIKREKGRCQENEILHCRVAELDESLQNEKSAKTALQLELDNSIRKLEDIMTESKVRLQRVEEESQSKFSSDIATVP